MVESHRTKRFLKVEHTWHPTTLYPVAATAVERDVWLLVETAADYDVSDERLVLPPVQAPDLPDDSLRHTAVIVPEANGSL
ncbi:hypothetical protein [Salinarchaeum laminariae]|uniref:hypothetical protein n=1 Tax=Salinarchaeum laminariae TaxID=869888 RepID=UPI0020BDD890|nr:hypothetical protein [Salinarchaeum laminariae]